MIQKRLYYNIAWRWCAIHICIYIFIMFSFYFYSFFWLWFSARLRLNTDAFSYSCRYTDAVWWFGCFFLFFFESVWFSFEFNIILSFFVCFVHLLVLWIVIQALRVTEQPIKMNRWAIHRAVSRKSNRFWYVCSPELQCNKMKEPKNEKKRGKNWRVASDFVFFSFFSDIYFFGVAFAVVVVVCEAEKSPKNLILYCWLNNEDIFPLNNKNMIPLFEHNNRIRNYRSFSFRRRSPVLLCTLSLDGRMFLKFHVIWLFNSDFFHPVAFMKKKKRKTKLTQKNAVFLSVCLSFYLCLRSWTMLRRGGLMSRSNNVHQEYQESTPFERQYT